MEKEKRVKKTYSPEFRKQAVELAESLGNYSQAARQLGVCEASLYEWRNKLKIVPASKGLSELEKEIFLLRRENEKLKQINTVLKHATAFFSQDPLK